MQKYQILSVIGQGAYGVVLKCRDIQSRSFVAIKKFKEPDDEEQTRKTTMREVKILKLASQSNIVELKEAFRKKGIVYLVFEFVQNNLLEVLQNSQGGMKLPIIKKIIYQLLKGMTYLHGLNIVHRDIKPQNLLISKDYKLKICDFGFARQFRSQKEEGLTDYVATRWYRPPQLLVGGDYGEQIDLWAVGCILGELIDGNPLFPGQNELDQLFLIQKSLGPLPSDLHERFIKNQRFLGMKFPQIQNLDKLQKKYFGKICQKGINLIKGLLKMDPKQRMTAAEALQHPFFQTQRENEKSCIQSQFQNNSRKQVYTSTSNRKTDLAQNSAERSIKYGNIYNNKRKNKRLEVVAEVYQSSNNCKVLNLNSKSVGKQQKKLTYNQQLSLQKHYNRDILMKTQTKGFYIDVGEDKFCGYGDNSKKSTQIGSVASNQQLPFLIYSQQNVEDEPNKKNIHNNKKKTQFIPSQKQTFNIRQVNINK